MSALAYADTSLLASLYLDDGNSKRAIAAVTAAAMPLMLTSWQQFELENAFQLRLYRKESNRAEVSAAAAWLSGDIAAGAVAVTALALDSVLVLARQLASRHTAASGTRAFDVFHVAAALHLKSDRFLSFDARQVALARASGLRVFNPL